MNTQNGNRTGRPLIGFLLLAASVTALEVRAQAPSPDVLVRSTTEEVLTIVRNDKDIKAGKVDRIVDLIEEKVAPHFDFARMTRLAVGRAWRDATPTQREALIKEFRSLLVRSYSAAFTAYTGVSVEYRPFRFNPGDSEATVQTLIKLPGGAEPITVDYDMALTPAGWKVYDVRVAGASLIINYRNLFALEIDRGGIDGLIKSLVNRNSANAAPAGKQ
ncbi:MAG TPA: ABC transporter substrate-binding protein [Burkholderiales bacterium]|jgi:phospholipid transport system substrate-binding protein|nr:ABC transporter substrate-binding protein [Burkholderiales bacterium]